MRTCWPNSIRNNGISVATAYSYLHEGLTVLADHAPDLSTALERAVAAGYTHHGLSAALIRLAIALGVPT